MKGLIALDIDGTLVDESTTLLPATHHYLTSLSKEGWILAFITGRTFHSAFPILSSLTFPYYLAVQNGALVLKMPEHKIIYRKYLNASFIPEFEKICAGFQTDFVIYSGYEHNNRCFYRPSHFSGELLAYLKERCLSFGEQWEEKTSFEHFEIDEFPSVKCFGKFEEASTLCQRIENELDLHVPLIKDPFREGFYVVQSTHADVSKGLALKDLVGQINYKGGVIAAGDDNNDASMLDQAHISIVMSSAPLEMQKKATIIAPSASSSGIIQALEQAIRLYLGET